MNRTSRKRLWRLTILLPALLICLAQGLQAQNGRLKALQQRLDSLARFIPGLNHNSDLALSDVPLHDYVRSLGIREDGVPAFEDVKERMKPEVINEKKAAAFVSEMQNTADINALANQIGAIVQSANAVTLASTTITGGYAERDVIGKAFRLNTGETGGPWVGDQGVYVVKMTSKTIGEDKTDYSLDKENMMTQRSSNAEGQIYNAMRKAAGVVDERRKFF